MGDFVDDDLPPPWISDLDLCRLIERITKQPATLADARVWRRVIERERARRGRRRYGLPPLTISAGSGPAHDIIVDMLTSSEFAPIIALLWSGGSLARDALDGPSRRLYDDLRQRRTLARDLRHGVDGLVQYANEKLAPGGRRAPPWPDPAHALPAAALAALNAASPAGLAEWRDRLARTRRAPATRPHVLAALRRTGTEVLIVRADLDLGRPCDGPSLGLWPPPPPETEELTAESEPLAAPSPRWRR